MKHTDEIKSSTYLSSLWREWKHSQDASNGDKPTKILSIYDTLLRDGLKGRGRQGARPSQGVIPRTHIIMYT